MSSINILKRNGSVEPLNLEKIHRVISWSVEGIAGVSMSEIELRAKLNFFDGMKSEQIQQNLIAAARDLISEETPQYDRVAARLVIYDVRKKAYGQYQPPALRNIVQRNVSLRFYDEALMENYSRDEWDELDEYIKHDRDDNFRYAGTQQAVGKYLAKDRTTGQIYESPQVMYMLMAAAGFMNEPQDSRMAFVKQFYDDLSLFRIGLATPLLAGLRTPTRQYSSCVVMDTADCLDSLGSTNWGIMRYIAKKAGIGLNIGRLRPEGSPIRGGEIKHTGLLPFLKAMRAAVKSCSQGGVRGGSATVNYPIWHQDVESLLVLKNNKGTEETRERHMDYCVQVDGMMWRKVVNDEKMALLDPTLPGLYDAFMSEDRTQFEKLYEKYSRGAKKVRARDLFQTLMMESKNTGRVYISNVDHVNQHTPFNEPIYMTNLCVEIALPTSPFHHIDDENGRVALCTLGNVNWGEFSKPEDMRGPIRRANRLLDNILSDQDYPMVQAKLATEEYRPLGFGVNNLAYWMAKNGVKYSDGSSLELVDEWMEAMVYFMQESTIDLAKERGPCKASENTKRAQGTMVVDTWNKNAERLVDREYSMDWQKLRELAKKYGVRNATMTAQMPSESNSQLMNSTNGIEPVRSLVTFKESKDGSIPICVPSITLLKNKYDMLWDQKSPRGYLEVAAVIQMWMCQAMSVNMFYNPNDYPDNKVPMSVLLGDHLYAYKLGIKNRYYLLTNDVNDALRDSPEELPSGEVDDGECAACTL